VVHHRFLHHRELVRTVSELKSLEQPQRFAGRCRERNVRNTTLADEHAPYRRAPTPATCEKWRGRKKCRCWARLRHEQLAPRPTECRGHTRNAGGARRSSSSHKGL